MLSWFITFFLASLLFRVAYFFITRNYDYWKKRGVPYIKPKPIFGSILEVALGRAHPGKYIGQFYSKFDSPYFGFFAFKKPYLVITDPELIKTVLIRDFNVFPNRYFVSDKKIDPVMSSGLFAIHNPTWRWLRQKQSPFLSYGKIKLMVPLIQECGDCLKDYINDNVGKMVEVKEMSAKYATDVIVRCAFGISANSFVCEDGFRLAGKTMLSQSFMRSLKIFSYYYAPLLVKIFKFKFIEPSAVDFVREAFLEAYRAREKSGVKNRRQDLIDILIEMKNEGAEFEGFKLDEENLVAQAVTLFSSGFEAAASTLAFTLHELAVNPEIQRKLRAEIKHVVEKDGDVCFSGIQSMKYLNMTITETMRMFPATSFIHRECLEDYKIPSTGLVIEKGTPIIVGQYGLHYDERYFPEPHIYRPERFSDENMNQIGRCTYLPFGEGPRSCIGQMLGVLLVKVAVVEILRNFSIERHASTVEPVILTPFPIVQAKGGLPLMFKHLSDNF
ncbi:hypothetical protein PPYR_06623 [Photinus pyralis]|uniref:Cytochrome P450 n=1 Tax=Photinus pyralis TaxID=7054 RepID=A0A5N4AN93_PHOPY|nr:cytochrome P450 6k1-like [Photinus pyralis]XP_031340771.1 cytochrome P450 6k1-like [Photinus pyralis]KAB0798743.1 hypothetical protein PPYR_06623 [Photinus pyralis]